MLTSLHISSVQKIVQELKLPDRRTNVETVFDHLYDDIVSMRLVPGTKLTESEIARRFGISRQPVRDAFSRLEHLDLLLARPQKATLVKHFSSAAITTARFVRASVEINVLRHAAQRCTQEGVDLLGSNINAQHIAVRDNKFDEFRALDFEFHRTLCIVGNVEFAFDVIAKEKATVDRLCVLAKPRDARLVQLLDDHISIAASVSNNDEEAAVKSGTLHLSRLDSIITTIKNDHKDYFDD